MRILIVYGSLREKSFNKALAAACVSLSPSDMSIELLSPAGLPLYNQDMEASFPAEITALKEKIRAADGVIIATPEYNRSIPGGLKNLIDWTSRPYGDSAWKGKPVGVIGASSGNIGTALAQYEVKKVMNYLETHVMGQPEFYLNASGKFDDSMQLTDTATKEHIQKYLDAFKVHVEKLS